MKRLVSFVLCIALLFSFPSCDSSLPASADVSSEYFPPVSSETSEPVSSETPSESEPEPESFTVAITGDICLADNYKVMKKAKEKGLEPIDCISPELVTKMRNADLCLVNNEFCFSDRGEPLSGKAYTFRAKPANVGILHQMGVDLAGLANNHVYDYGEEAFVDTLDTLSDAGIPYIGAGIMADEAYAPYYTEINGVKLAFLAASRAEKNYMTPVTEGYYPGIAGIYDWCDDRFVEEIRKADEIADVVIVYVHWGTEYSTTLQSSQKTLAREYIDAGADVVVGAHAHILQGIEFYNDVPIIYNLGNFWFNLEDIDTVLLELEFTGTDCRVHLVPAVQRDGMTTIVDGTEEGRRIFDHLERLSTDIVITDDGYVKKDA